MKTFDFSVLEYLGKVEDGVLVLLSVMHQRNYYEATFFYDDKNIILTISDELESVVGDIKKHPEYMDCLRDILRKAVPYDEMFERIDPVNFGRWVEGFIELEIGEAERVSASQIKPIG